MAGTGDKRGARRFGMAAMAALCLLTQTGCLVIAGYSSRGGWFLWPGGLGGLLLILLVLFVLLRR